jgi:hypothetical protein
MPKLTGGFSVAASRSRDDGRRDSAKRREIVAALGLCGGGPPIAAIAMSNSSLSQ